MITLKIKYWDVMCVSAELIINNYPVDIKTQCPISLMELMRSVSKEPNSKIKLTGYYRIKSRIHWEDDAWHDVYTLYKELTK